MKTKAYAPGKVILFGEHAVVYGYSALAAAIDRGVDVTIEESDEDAMISKYGKVKLSSKKKPTKRWYYPLCSIVDRFEKENNIELPKLKITIESELPKGCGAGSAAAAALAKALYFFTDKEVDRQTIFDYVTFADAIMHGNKASGLDAHTVVCGGYVFFDGKEFQLSNMEKQKVVICDSGKRASTEKQIGLIEKFKTEKPGDFDAAMSVIDTASQGGCFYLSLKDLDSVGDYMGLDHMVLQHLGISCKELDEIVEIAKEREEYGAKLTGAGGGGAAIILPKNPQACLDDLLSRGYDAFIAEIGLKYE